MCVFHGRSRKTKRFSEGGESYLKFKGIFRASEAPMWAWKARSERADGVSCSPPILFFAPREGTKTQRVVISGIISALIICKQLF